MRSKLTAILTCLFWASASLIFAGEVEVYRTDEGPQSKTVYYVKNVEETAGQFLARSGFAGQHMWSMGEISVEEYHKRMRLKESALSKLGLTEEEFDTLMKR